MNPMLLAGKAAKAWSEAGNTYKEKKAADFEQSLAGDAKGAKSMSDKIK